MAFLYEVDDYLPQYDYLAPYLAALQAQHGPQRSRTTHKRQHAPPAQAQRPILVDVDEDDVGFIVSADVPGVEKEAVQVAFDKDTIELSVQQPSPPAPTVTEKGEEEGEEEGARQSGQPESEQQITAEVSKKRRLHRSERSQNFANRQIRLPPTAELSQTKASLSNGVLTLLVPKNEDKVKPKRVLIE